MSPSIKVKDIQRELRSLGGRPLRCKGSHETWALPSGRRVVLVVHHPGAPPSDLLRSRLRRAIASERLEQGRAR